MPNTNPVNDNFQRYGFYNQKGDSEGACTGSSDWRNNKGAESEELAEMGIMYSEGCVAFSDDGKPVASSLIMRRALEYSRAFNVPIISHCEDIGLSGRW